MKIVSSFWLIVLTVFSPNCVASDVEWFTIAKSGKTLIEKTLGVDPVRVIITTREENIGSPTTEPPERRKNSCTFTRYPCSLIEEVEVFVNGVELFVPRSAYSDISDLHKVSVTRKRNRLYLLVLDGGDASEGYQVEILMSEHQVQSRKKFSGIVPGELLEKTDYFAPSTLD